MIYLSGFGGFCSCYGFSGEHSHGQRREAGCAEHTEGRFTCCLWTLLGFDFRGEIFILNKERTKGDKEAVDCFCLFCVPLHAPFFSVPNSEVECLALGGEAEGEVFFLNFPGISLVLYFFGAQKPCRDITRESTRSDRAKGPAQRTLRAL